MFSWEKARGWNGNEGWDWGMLEPTAWMKISMQGQGQGHQAWTWSGGWDGQIGSAWSPNLSCSCLLALPRAGPFPEPLQGGCSQ